MDTMSKEARKARSEYFKKWRKANPGKVAATQARYWEKKAKEAEKNDVQNRDDPVSEN